ncbi:flagellar hook protein FlgE [Azospirillum lipoferum]|nr:flagellar hook protein FlgE [Azospirillum lipoferum]
MSLYSAMRSGVSGMSAQSSRLAAISDNISNSQTVGYKRATVDFSTLLTSPGSSVYTAGGVQSSSRYQIEQDGTPIGTNSATDMAISGSGFFVVGNNSSGSPQYSLTRAGSFKPDDSGYLRNTAGQYLEAWKLAPDGSLPNVSTTRFDDLEPVNIGNLLYGGSRTTGMQFSGNLPGQAVSGDTFTTTPSFYDGLGNAQDLKLTWTKTANPNEWTLGATAPTGYTVTGAPVTVTFAATGPYAGMPVDGSGNPVTPASFTITSPATPTADTITFSMGNVTQLNGDYIPQVIGDGAKVGRVSTVNIDDTGKLWVVYDNGARQALYQVPVANVVNPDGLVAQNGNTFTLGMDAGPLSLSKGNSAGAGSVIGGALEQSNVDIATELVSLIETQRAYSSNATIVRTADEMVDETNRLKR